MTGPVTAGRFARVLLVGGLIAAVCVVLATLVGAEDVDVLAVLRGGGTEVERAILLDVRLPRVLAAALVGAGLAVCGVAFQSLLRNPLAEPYLLGISGGGAFGAVLAIVVLGGAASALPLTRGAAAFLGCLLALGLVYLVASRGGALHPATLLLAGVVTNAFFLAAIASLQYAANPHQARAILVWVMGGFTSPTRAELVLLAVTGLLGIGFLLSRAGALDLLAFGEETARSLGVDVAWERRAVFIAASLVTASSVAVAGPIGFLGLFVPHTARAFVGSGHRVLIPAAACAGAAFLPVADALARTVIQPSEIPVGIVTALIGAPAFVVILARSRRLASTGVGADS